MCECTDVPMEQPILSMICHSEQHNLLIKQPILSILIINCLLQRRAGRGVYWDWDVAAPNNKKLNIITSFHPERKVARWDCRGRRGIGSRRHCADKRAVIIRAFVYKPEY